MIFSKHILNNYLPKLLFLSLLASTAFAYSGGTGEPNSPYQIASKDDLLVLAATPADYGKSFILTADINMAGQAFTTAIIAPDTSSSTGFQGTVFTGAFDGNGHKITHFTIYSTINSYLALFGYIGAGCSVKNLDLENFSVSGYQYVGSLVGRNYGSISNCYSTGAVSGYAGSQYVGGLIGINDGGISNSYSTGAVSGTSYVGGLTGNNNGGSVSNCYSAGAVSSGSAYVGGLAGRNLGSISNCYSTGAVSGGSQYVGGLVGINNSSITNCYSTGHVSGSATYVGGLIGYSSGGPTNSFWDVNSSGRPTSSGGTGKTTVQMKTRSTFTDVGWDFVGEIVNGPNDIWRMCVDGLNYPKLSWQFMQGDFGCPDGVDIYDLAVFSDHWLLEGTPYDINNDGIVNFKDFALFAENWLKQN